jgi:DNA-binding NtrC family response regulator
VKVDVRILATTNRDLTTEVRRGTFREDLYFRLNVVSLRIPALRERPGDIPALAEYFCRKYATVNGLPYRALTPAAITRLTAHHWRGNVREMENVLHRAVLLATGPEIGAEDIELTQSDGTKQPAGATSAGGVASLVGRRMDDVEQDLIIQTLGHTLGNRTHAATILGISIRALRNKLRDYTAHGIAVPPPATSAV